MTITERSRTAYFNVPASEQPLRVRQPAPQPEREPEPRHSVLEQLVIAPTIYGHDPAFADEDRQEANDAFWECAHGRLAHDRTPPCGCWPQEPAPMPVPDLIPAWVLADARDLRAQGMTVRKIARMILPATDCADVPSCEQLLKLQLESQEVK